MTALLCTFLIVAAAGPADQAKPNFSGRWEIVSPERSKGAEMIVTHDEKMLVVDHLLPKGQTRRQTFVLDAAEHREVLPVPGTSVTLFYRTSWEGSRLIITSRMEYSGGMKTQARDVWSLGADGRLTLETSESGARGAASPVSKVVFARKS